MAYQLQGSLLEVCTCRVLCPCWVGEDPDGDICQSVNAWHIAQGTVDGIDVSGLTVATLNHIPGNVLNGNWRIIIFIDDKATAEQQAALVNVFTGKLGGPVADLAQLYSEVVAVERVPIVFATEGGQGHLKVGADIEAEMAPFRGATGHTTTLHDTAFSTIPGSPAYISKATRYRARNATLRFDIDLQEHNAIQGNFRFEG
jgi:hypothetical protein